MKDSKQIEILVERLTNLVNTFTEEFDLPIASVLGCLEIVKLDLFTNLKNEQN